MGNQPSLSQTNNVVIGMENLNDETGSRKENVEQTIKSYRIFSTIPYFTTTLKYYNLHEVKPYLYEFDIHKRVCKITHKEFLDQYPTETKGYKIYFIYGNYDDSIIQDVAENIIKKMHRREIECFVIVENENDLLTIQQGQPMGAMEQPINKLENLLPISLEDVLNTKDELFITKGFPEYIETFFKAYYKVKNCQKLASLFKEETNSIIKYGEDMTSGKCLMISQTENDYYIFKLSTDINFDLERIQFYLNFDNDTFYKEMIPKMLFVNLMTKFEDNIIKTLQTYQRFRIYSTENDEYTTIMKQFLKNPLYYIVSFYEYINLFFKVYNERNITEKTLNLVQQIKDRETTALELLKDYTEESQRIIITKYSYGPYLIPQKN